MDYQYSVQDVRSGAPREPTKRELYEKSWRDNGWSRMRARIGDPCFWLILGNYGQ